MNKNIALKALAVWFCILVLAVLNGIAREALLTPNVGVVAGYLLSGLLLSLFIILIAYLFLPWVGARQFSELAGVGLYWLGLTIIFEFSFGLWQGLSWQELFAAYTFEGGNIWPIVLLVTAFAPYLAAKLRGWKMGRDGHQT